MDNSDPIEKTEKKRKPRKRPRKEKKKSSKQHDTQDNDNTGRQKKKQKRDTQTESEELEALPVNENERIEETIGSKLSVPFSDLSLDENTQKSIDDMGFDTMMPIQAASIPV